MSVLRATLQNVCRILFVFCLVFVLGLFLPWYVWAQAALENPQPASDQSGIGVISGWVCEATTVEIEIDGGTIFEAAYGTSRGDTASVCGDANNGFSLLFNWNLLGDGLHTVRVLADGVEVASVTVTVTTLGLGEFPTGLSGAFTLVDFPAVGDATNIQWQQSQQNFVIVNVEEVSSPLPTGTYTGTLDATTTNCEPEEDDDEFTLSGDMTVTINTGTSFRASGALSIGLGGFTFTLDLNLSGTSTTAGAISGAYTTDFMGTNGFTSTGSGTFTGSITNSTLEFALTGQDTDIFGITCTLMGTFIGAP